MPHGKEKLPAGAAGYAIPRARGSDPPAPDSPHVRSGNLRLLFHRRDRRAAVQDLAPPGVTSAAKQRWGASRREVDALSVDHARRPPRGFHSEKHDRGPQAGQRNAEGLRAPQPRLLRPEEPGSSAGRAIAGPAMVKPCSARIARWRPYI